MDSTLISTRPDEATASLSRARRSALGSFAGAVVDWYDFLLYGIMLNIAQWGFISEQIGIAIGKGKGNAIVAFYAPRHLWSYPA